MVLQWSRYSALVFAIGLAIGEAVINWGHWQFWPLWVVDYVIVVWLLTGFIVSRKGGHTTVLLTGWTFACGVFYMAVFITLDNIREGREEMTGIAVLLVLMSTMLVLTMLGVVSAALAPYGGKSTAIGKGV